MVEMAVGAAAGMLVCLFGMWAFLKGQAAGMDAAAGARPRLTRPRAAADKADDLTEQVKALFARPEERQNETREGNR